MFQVVRTWGCPDAITQCPFVWAALEDFLEKGARTWAKTPTRGDSDRDEKVIAFIVINNCRSWSFIASRILLGLQEVQNRAGTSKSARADNRALCLGKAAAFQHSSKPIWFEIYDDGIVRNSDHPLPEH